jgi:hypothetical protein
MHSLEQSRIVLGSGRAVPRVMDPMFGFNSRARLLSHNIAPTVYSITFYACQVVAIIICSMVYSITVYICWAGCKPLTTFYFPTSNHLSRASYFVSTCSIQYCTLQCKYFTMGRLSVQPFPYTTNASLFVHIHLLCIGDLGEMSNHRHNNNK